MMQQNEPVKRMGCLARVRQIALGIAIVVSVALLAGAFYQQSAMASDRSAYVSDSDLVEVNGVEMHFRCTGEGSPTVVFESGAGTPYLNWWEIQAAISQDVRTCAYDRQNIGWSA